MFNLSKASFYADFATVPCAMLGTLWCLFAYGIGASLWPFLLMAVVGYLAWTLVEYITHRYLFHRMFRREHWLHHLRPRSDIGAPAYITTTIIALLWLGCIGSFGVRWGGGLNFGLMAGYLTYISVHNWIHRWHVPRWHFLRAAHDRHNIHHRGKEVNFNVLWPVWDRIFGTYEQPKGA